MYTYYKPHILANPKLYESLYHDTIFDKQDKTNNMLGINLKMMDIFEIIHNNEVLFQRCCTVAVNGSISANFSHYSTSIYHYTRNHESFMRRSYRKCKNHSHKVIISLVGDMAVALFARISKHSLHGSLFMTLYFGF